MTVDTIYKVTLLSFFLLVAEQIFADDGSREAIKDKVEFYYYDNPMDDTFFGIDNNAVADHIEEGEFWSNSNTTVFRGLVRALLMDASAGGDSGFQDLVASILARNERKIQIYLWNDTQSLAGQEIPWFIPHIPSVDREGHIWPQAAHWTRDQDYFWGGYVDLGVHYVTTQSDGTTRVGADQWIKDNFLCQLMYTQYRMLNVGNSFLVVGEPNALHAGLKKLPNDRLAVMKAGAEVLWLKNNWSEFEKRFKWFADNGKIAVKREEPSNYQTHMRQLFGNGDYTWLYDQIIAEPTVLGFPTSHYGSDYLEYGIQDLPPKMVVNNEVVIGLTMAMASKCMSDVTPLLVAIRESQDFMALTNGQTALPHLVNAFARATLPSGESFGTIGQRLQQYGISGESFRSVLPLAFFDYFTAFSSTDKEEFIGLFNGALDEGLVDLYWSHFKRGVRSVSLTGQRDWSEMVAIAGHCATLLACVDRANDHGSTTVTALTPFANADLQLRFVDGQDVYPLIVKRIFEHSDSSDLFTLLATKRAQAKAMLKYQENAADYFLGRFTKEEIYSEYSVLINKYITFRNSFYDAGDLKKIGQLNEIVDRLYYYLNDYYQTPGDIALVDDKIQEDFSERYNPNSDSFNWLLLAGYLLTIDEVLQTERDRAIVDRTEYESFLRAPPPSWTDYVQASSDPNLKYWFCHVTKMWPMYLRQLDEEGERLLVYKVDMGSNGMIDYRYLPDVETFFQENRVFRVYVPRGSKSYYKDADPQQMFNSLKDEVEEYHFKINAETPNPYKHDNYWMEVGLDRFLSAGGNYIPSPHFTALRESGAFNDCY